MVDHTDPWHYLVLNEDDRELYHPFGCEERALANIPCCCKTAPKPGDYAHVEIKVPNKGRLKLVCPCADCDPDRYLQCLECTFGNCTACEWRYCSYFCLTGELIGEGGFHEDPGAYWVQGWSARDYWGEYNNGLMIEFSSDRPELTITNQGIDYDCEVDS